MMGALRFECADIAVELTGAIQKCLALVHGPTRSKLLSAQAVLRDRHPLMPFVLRSVKVA